MALNAGVDARVISGDAGGPHAWNIVRLNGKYYNLDSTWDAGRENYSYFLKSMKAFSDHERDEDYSSSEFTEAYPMAESDYQETEEIGGIEKREYGQIMRQKHMHGEVEHKKIHISSQMLRNWHYWQRG